MKNKLDFIFPLIIVGVFIIRAIKAAMEQRASSEKKDLWTGDSSGGSEDDWTEWEPSSTSPSASSTPPPPPVAAVISAARVLHLHQASVSAPTARPAPTCQRSQPAAPTTVKEMPMAKPLTPDDESKILPLAPLNETMADVAAQNVARFRNLMTDNLQQAFPLPPPDTSAEERARPRIVLGDVANRASLRRAMILREVLDHPRAFDL